MTWLLANWKIALVGVLLALLGVQTVRVAGLQQDAADRRAVDAESQRLAERAQREIETRHQKSIEEVSAHAEAEKSALAADLAASRTAADGLRAAAADAARRARTHTCAAASGPGEPDPDPIGVLADVLGRADQRAGVLAEHADRLRIAGSACERSYGALTEGAANR